MHLMSDQTKIQAVGYMAVNANRGDLNQDVP